MTWILFCDLVTPFSTAEELSRAERHLADLRKRYAGDAEALACIQGQEDKIVRYRRRGDRV